MFNKITNKFEIYGKKRFNFVINDENVISNLTTINN